MAEMQSSSVVNALHEIIRAKADAVEYDYQYDLFRDTNRSAAAQIARWLWPSDGIFALEPAILKRSLAFGPKSGRGRVACARWNRRSDHVFATWLTNKNRFARVAATCRSDRSVVSTST